MAPFAKTVSGSMMMDFGIRLLFQGAQRFYLFDLAGEDFEESCPRCAVDRLMIAGERQADGIDQTHATLYAHRLKLDGTDAENRHLRRMEDGGERLDPQVPQVADGKCGAPEVVGGDGAPNGLVRQVPDLGGKLRDGELLAVLYDRDVEPAICVAGEPEIDGGMAGNAAIDELRIQRRGLEERLGDAEEDHVADG